MILAQLVFFARNMHCTWSWSPAAISLQAMVICSAACLAQQNPSPASKNISLSFDNGRAIWSSA
jgi:hypothetical protein